MMPRAVSALALLVLLAATLAPPAPAAPRFGEPKTVYEVNRYEASVLDALSDGRGLRAFVSFERTTGANHYVLSVRRGRGWRRVELTRAATRIELVALETGGGLALYLVDGTLVAREWDSVGTVQAERVVIDGIRPADGYGGDWQVRSDRKGTVVLAGVGAPPLKFGGVYAAIRDPGQPFGPTQELAAAFDPTYGTGTLSIQPIESDGSVTVRWEDGPQGSGQATRRGHARGFGPAEPVGPDPTQSDGVQRSDGSVAAVADGSDRVTLAASAARLCPCSSLQRFAWAGGREALLFHTQLPDRAWFVARRAADGSFAHPRRVTGRLAARPVQLPMPGEIGFLRTNHDTDFGLFRHDVHFYVVPFGERADRRAPQVSLGPVATHRGRRLLVPAWCDEPCRITATATIPGVGTRKLALISSDNRRRGALLEPFDIVWLRLVSNRLTRPISIRATVRDHGRRRAQAAATYAQGRGPMTWCRAGFRSRNWRCP